MEKRMEEKQTLEVILVGTEEKKTRREKGERRRKKPKPELNVKWRKFRFFQQFPLPSTYKIYIYELCSSPDAFLSFFLLGSRLPIESDLHTHFFSSSRFDSSRFLLSLYAIKHFSPDLCTVFQFTWHFSFGLQSLDEGNGQQAREMRVSACNGFVKGKSIQQRSGFPSFTIRLAGCCLGFGHTAKS